MRTTPPFRHVFAVGAAATLLAGCGGSQLPIGNSQNATQASPLAPNGLTSLGTSGYAVIHDFRASAGDSPVSLIEHNGNFFGTTMAGGSKSCNCGVAFELTPSATGYEYALLHVFAGGGDGAVPYSSLSASASGAVYGATSSGGGTACKVEGSVGCGTVFKLTPSNSGYAYSVLYRFKGGVDGQAPVLAKGATDDEQLFGVTLQGGRPCQCGTIFKLTRSGGSYTHHVLWRFGTGVLTHSGTLAMIGGKLYGVAGGDARVSASIYRLDDGRPAVIYRFLQSRPQDGSGGAVSTIDASGNLFGASGGGDERCQLIKHVHTGCGLIFELAPRGARYVEHVVHRFSPGADGWGAGGVAYRNGTLYGATLAGGTVCDGLRSGCGTVFSMPAGSGKETVLYRFTGGRRGAFPSTHVIVSQDGDLYGATENGGYGNAGALYRLRN